MKEQEENIAIIRSGDYVDEIEQKVALEVNRITTLGLPERREKKYVHTTIPEFGKDNRARIEWEMEEIRRCREGFDNIPPEYYYYLNHTRIKNKQRGNIRPDFRVMDLEWFKFRENILKTPGAGIVCIKRRQVGMSWKAAASMVHACSFKFDYDIGFNSKSETDSRNLFKKVKHIYRHQNDFLRASTSTDRRDALEFVKYGKDKNDNKIVTGGTGSTIISVAPVPTAHAGNQYLELICDEAGETDELEAIISNAEDCIMQDGVRCGALTLFGTMGETSTAGKGLMEFWKNHKMYDLHRFAFYGYHELIMDSFGNDDITESVRWVLYSRKKRENGSPKLYNKFVQKYPLHELDAFLSITGYGVGNPLLIGQQQVNLMNNPPEKRIGRMKMIGTEPHFEPNPLGNVVITDLPEKIDNGYTSCVDPAEDDDIAKTKDSSDIGFTIVARPFGLKPARIVAEYCHRPKKLADAYQQIALLCMLYKCKLHIEMNKGGWRMYDWFALNHSELLALGVRAANGLKKGSDMKYGVKMTAPTKIQMEGLLETHIEEYCLPIPEIGYDGITSEKVLEQFKVFGGDGQDDDLAMSFGWNLVIQQSDRKTPRRAGDEKPQKTIALQYVKGNLVRVGVTPAGGPKVPKHPLFG